MTGVGQSLGRQLRLSERVANQLVKAREAGTLTQTQVARRMGVTQTAVSYWESGKRLIGLDELQGFAVATCKPLDFFLPPDQPSSSRPMLMGQSETSTTSPGRAIKR